VTQVKICGITNKDDALFAAQCGAAALGFIFYPPSPRYITPEDARKIIPTLPDKVVKVGVFVNEKGETIKQVMEYCALDMIQLHGDESPEFCRQFPSSIVIKTISLTNDDDLKNAFCYGDAAILVDSRHRGLYGGTGKKVDWDLAVVIRNKKPLILSGGLNEGNITEAIRTVAPAALDLNSGVELSPGKKDHLKLARIFEMMHAADTAQKNTLLIFSKRKT